MGQPSFLICSMSLLTNSTIFHLSTVYSGLLYRSIVPSRFYGLHIKYISQDGPIKLQQTATHAIKKGDPYITKSDVYNGQLW